MNPSQLRARYREAHDLVVQAWTRDDTFAFNGRYNQQRYINIWPQPVQKPRPPIWIPGGGSVETWQWCAEMDYVYAYLCYFGYQLGRETMRGFWREMDKLGKDRNPYRAAFLQFVGVAETRAEAMKLYREPAEYFFNRCLHVDPRYASPPGYVTEATMRAKMVSMAQGGGRGQRARPAGGGLPNPTFEDMVDKGYVIIGSPDEVADKLREVATELNVGHLMLLLQFGNMGKDLTNENSRLFAQKVAPQLQESVRRQMGRSLVAEAAADPGARGAGVVAPRVVCGPPRMSDVAERFVEVNGAPCRVWEKGEGKPLYFLAGVAGLPRWTEIPGPACREAPRRGAVAAGLSRRRGPRSARLASRLDRGGARSARSRRRRRRRSI